VKYQNATANTANGSWNLSKVSFCKGARIPPWTYLWIRDNSYRQPWADNTGLKNTIDAFKLEMRNRGLNTEQFFGPGFAINGIDYNQPSSQIDKQFDVIAADKRKPKLLLVILPKADSLIYNRVKYMGDVKHGIHTICVIGSKLAKTYPNGSPDLQYFANVALKFNLKLGGANQFLDSSKLGIVALKKTMVVGLDVTHPSPGSSSKAPSVVGIVSSVDNTLAQWPADIRIQESRQEMVSALDILLKSRLKLWRQKNNNSLPENILVYRDGISEGQYSITLEQEVPLLRKACEETYPATDTKKGLPRISLLVVGKRHHTRFYPTTESGADNSSNPENGTIVDRGVTEARNWDFFLQAHTALHGTARPAHYYVVLDEIFRKAPKTINAADDLEDLTHNMCYLFGRATKAVSICPPAYYADLVCERARCYLSGLFDAGSTPTASIAGSLGAGGQAPDPDDVVIHPALKDTMFYL
jgi:eukaryotic translation initiation factor 2C